MDADLAERVEQLHQSDRKTLEHEGTDIAKNTQKFLAGASCFSKNDQAFIKATIQNRLGGQDQVTKIVKKRLRQAAGVVVQELPAPENDRAALARLFEQSDGENWKNRKNWLEAGMALSSWHGVSTRNDDDEVVTELNLNDNAILMLGSAIGFLCSLTKVDISFNKELSGECTLVCIHDPCATCDVITIGLPNEIGNLQSLTKLSCCNCKSLKSK